MYAYAIGQCGIKPAEYWLLTEAETIGIIAGHQRLTSYNSENYRNIYGAIIRYMGEKGSVKKFWPLPTDYDGQKEITPEYIAKRNEIGMEIAKRIGFLN